MHDVTTRTRADAAAARAQREALSAQRRRDVEAVHKIEETLRKQRAEQQASVSAVGRKASELSRLTRASAKEARDRISEDHLTEAKAGSAERLEALRRASENKAALREERKVMAKQRRDAELTIRA